MKFLKFLAVCCSIVLFSCSQAEECRNCTGTVTNSGDMASWTVCTEDGAILTQINDLTGEIMTTNNSLAEAVAFFGSIGLSCE